MHYKDIREVEEDGATVVKAFCEYMEKEVTFYPKPGNTMRFVGPIPEEVNEYGCIAHASNGGIMMPRRGMKEEDVPQVLEKLQEISDRVQQLEYQDRYMYINEDGSIEMYKRDDEEYIKFYFRVKEEFIHDPGIHRLKISTMTSNVEEVGYENFDEEEIIAFAMENGPGFIMLMRCEDNCVLLAGKLGRDDNGSLVYHK